MIKSVNDLKDIFSTGNQANETAFGDLFDSSYNKSDDSILIGPVGLTGSIGLYLSEKGATEITSPSVTGTTGETVIFPDGGNTVYLYIHNGTQWMRFSGTDDW